MSRFISCILFFVLLSALFACTNSATYPARSPLYMERIEPRQRYVVEEPLHIQQSNSVAGRFNAQMIFLADQLERNIDRKNLDNTYIVTSFSNLNKLSETTPLGKLVAENLIHELQVRKWKVFEVRLNKDVVLNDAGEYSVSREIQKLQESSKIGGIITGTYSVAENHVIINARVIDISTGMVTSSGQIHLPGSWFTDALLFGVDGFKSMKIVSDSPSRY